MRFPEYNPPNLHKKGDHESVAQKARKEAIKILQKNLEEDKDMSIKVRTARLQALIKLLEKEEEVDHGNVVMPEMMHYTEPNKNTATELIAESEKNT